MAHGARCWRKELTHLATQRSPAADTGPIEWPCSVPLRGTCCRPELSPAVLAQSCAPRTFFSTAAQKDFAPFSSPGAQTQLSAVAQAARTASRVRAWLCAGGQPQQGIPRAGTWGTQPGGAALHFPWSIHLSPAQQSLGRNNGQDQAGMMNVLEDAMRFRRQKERLNSSTKLFTVNFCSVLADTHPAAI